MTLQTLTKYFIGTLIIFFVIWNRFLRQRGGEHIFSVPLELIILSNICLIILFAIILYLNSKKAFHLKKQHWVSKKILEYKLTQKILYFIREYIFNTPQFLYNSLTKNLDLAPLLELPASYFTAYFNYPRIIVLGFLELPLIIVSTFFLIDNLFFNNLNHFFFSLLFLIPALFMRVWLFVVDSYSTRRLDHLYTYLITQYLVEEKRYIVYLKPDDQLPVSEEFPLFKIKEKFLVLCDFWEIYSRIYSFMKHIQSYRDFYDPYVQLYTSFAFLIGWSIQLHHNLTYLTI